MAAIGEATPKVGKTNAKWCRLILDSTDLSGVSNQVGSVGVEYDSNDLAGYGDGVHYFQLGQANHILSGYQAVFSNTATTGSHTELKDREEYVSSFCIGARGIPEIGSVAWLSNMEQISYDVQGGGGSELVSVDFLKAPTAYNLALATHDKTNPWGVVLEAGTALSATATNAGVDNEAATTNGFVAHLHVVASDGGIWAFTIETSSDDAAADPYAVVETFAADGTAVTAERVHIAGAVERYIRFVATRTGGTCTVWCTLARGINLDA